MLTCHAAQAINCVGNGIPYFWALLAMALTCVISHCIGYARSWQFFSSFSQATKGAQRCRLGH
jgi:hypothetical protein